MNYLLYSKESSDTGKELLQWLIDKGADIQGGTNPGDETIHHLIRWGSTASLKKKTTGKVLNSKEAVVLASDKAKALKVMRDADVNTPVMWDGPGHDMEFPALGRASKHTHGSDIKLCLQESDVAISSEQGCTHWTKFIPIAREFRVHVFGGFPIKVSEKILTDPTKFVPYCRNFETGWTFHNPKILVPKAVKLEAISAVEALGLTFGAVDVAIDTNGKVYVFEVNTGPGLIETGVECYGKMFLMELLV